jgi:hypothetical protein
MWDDVRQGAGHFKRWSEPPPNRPVRQFFHGMSLPFHLLRALWADPVARRRYLRVGILQSLAVIALALTCHGSGNKVADSARKRVDRTGSASAAVTEAAAEDPEHQERERFKLEVKAAADEFKREVIARTGAQEEAELARQFESIEAAETPAQAAGQAQGSIKDELKIVAKRSKDLVESGEFQFWIALFAAMQIAQWVVIALSRDYHDAIGRDVSLLTALEPEDPPLTPRIRVDPQWLRKRLRRYIRGMVVVMAGMPVLYGFTAPFPFSKTLMAVLVPLWSGYWVVVFTVAKSAHAWKNSAAGEPWFLRAWNWLTTRVPGFRWRFLQRYGLFWANRTREVFPPSSETEKQPWAFAGLTLVEVLAMLPVVKCFLRPLVPVAATHLLVAKRAAESADPSKPAEPPAEPPDTSSASAA